MLKRGLIFIHALVLFALVQVNAQEKGGVIVTKDS